MAVYTPVSGARQQYDGNTQLDPSGAQLLRDHASSGGTGCMAAFTFHVIMPQGVNVDQCQLMVDQGNQLVVDTNHGVHLYLAVENCLDNARAFNDAVDGDANDPLVKRLTAHADAVTEYGSRTGITHSGDMAVDSAVGPLDGSPGYVVHAWDNTASPAASEEVTFFDFSSCLQPLVDDSGWDETGQDVNVFLFWSQANNPGSGNWDLYLIDNTVDWDNGEEGASETGDPQTNHTNSSGQINWNTDPELTVEYSTSEMIMDGVGSSVGNAKARESLLLAKWYGLDSGYTTDPIFSGVLPKIVAGRGDLPITRQDGENPFTTAWYISEGDPATAQVSTNIFGPGEGAFQRRCIYGEDFALLYSDRPYIYWDLTFWNPTKILGPISTYSARWLSKVFQVTASLGNTEYGVLCRGYKEGVWKWSIEYNNNFVGSESRELRVRTDDGFNSGYTDYALQERLGAQWNRLELQVSDEDTEYNFRLRAFVDQATWGVTEYDDTATFRMDLNIPVVDIDIDEIRYGSSTQDNGTNLDVHSWYLADTEWWSDYDLNGEFQNPVIDPDRGAPLVTGPFDSAPFEMEFYDYDGTDITSKEYIGTVLKPNSGPDALLIDGDYIPDDRLTWIEDLAGANGAAVTAGVTNEYDAKNGTVVYDTDETPAGESTALIYSTSVVGDDSSMEIDLPASTRTLHFRAMYYVDSTPQAQGSTNETTDILRFEDSSGDAIMNLRMNWAGDISGYDGEISSEASYMGELVADEWQQIEIFIDLDADSDGADNIGQLMYRFGNEETGKWGYVGLYRSWQTEVNTNDIDKIVVGLAPAWDANTGGSAEDNLQCDLSVAGVAYDMDTWCGPPPSSNLAPIPLPVVKDSYMGTATFRGTPIASAFVEGVDYIKATGIKYDMDEAPGSQRICDVYYPNTTPPTDGFPVLQWMHGGSWTSGNKNDLARNIRDAAIANGWAIVSTAYQLGGSFGVWTSSSDTAGRWPTYVCDFKQCGAWIRDEAHLTYPINPNIMVAGGYSAGSFNAMAAVLTRDLEDDGSPYDPRLTGNPSYLYSDVADPEYLGFYGWAIPTSPYALYQWQYGPGASEPNEIAGGQQIAYYAVQNLMGNQTDWQTDTIYLQPLNWVQAQQAQSVALVEPNNLSDLVLGGMFGWSDYFVFSDPENRYPEYGQYAQIELATLSLDAPASFDMDWFTFNGLNHDYVDKAFDATHMNNFLSQFR